MKIAKSLNIGLLFLEIEHQPLHDTVLGIEKTEIKIN